MTTATEYTPEYGKPSCTIERREILRGDIFYIDKYGSGEMDGSVQNAGRPAIIVSNNRNNATSTTYEVVWLTTAPKKDLPTHVTIRSAYKPSTALCEQIMSVSVNRIGRYIGHCTDDELRALEIALSISLDIDGGTSARKAPEKNEAETRKPEQDAAQSEAETKLREMQIRLTEEYQMKEVYKALYTEELYKRLKMKHETGV